jgi:hypothetical protein
VISRDGTIIETWLWPVLALVPPEVNIRAMSTIQRYPGIPASDIIDHVDLLPCQFAIFAGTLVICITNSSNKWKGGILSYWQLLFI